MSMRLPVSNPDNKLPNIAIDGPAGAGKTTIARMVARQLGFCHIDSGAMYRAVTLLALERSGESAVADEGTAYLIARDLDIDFLTGTEGDLRVMVQGDDRTEQLRSNRVDRYVSVVASMGDVRKELVAKQKELAEDGGVVMDGRDIGTHVLRGAEVKIFLTAAPSVRVYRRLRQQRQKGVHLSWDEAEDTVVQRDRIDSTRRISPLKVAVDAVTIDSTHLMRRDVVSQIEFILASVIRCPNGG